MACPRAVLPSAIILLGHAEIGAELFSRSCASELPATQQSDFADRSVVESSMPSIHSPGQGFTETRSTDVACAAPVRGQQYDPQPWLQFVHLLADKSSRAAWHASGCIG